MMAQGQLLLVLRNLRRAGSGAAGVPDAQLLERFVRTRDETAFELLLRRHERLVLSVCRRTLRQRQDVEDAFQATFLTLACKAGSISKGEALGSWLYKVAQHVALRQRTSSARRQGHERRAVAECAGVRAAKEPGTQLMERDLTDLLHEEVNRLPEKYRSPVVLCYLEGQTNEQAGVQLRCTAGTISTRLARARRRLRSRLEQRGLAFPAGALAAVLTEANANAAALVSCALRNATIRAALMFSGDRTATGLVSTQVATLTQGALRAMFLTKVKFAAALLLSIGVIGAGSGVLAFRHVLPKDQPLPSAPALVLEPQGQEKSRRSKPEQPTLREVEKRRSDQGARLEEVVSKSFKTGRAPRVFVELFNGGIIIDARGHDMVDVRAIKYGRAATEEAAKKALQSVDLKISQDGDTVRVQATRPEQQGSWGVSSGVSAELKVPRGAALELSTRNGPIDLTGGTGKIHLKTSNGKIQIKDSKGQLDARTSNGSIKVTGATGRIELKTRNGAIEIHGDKAVVNAVTSNGRVLFVGSLAGGKHSIRTSNGQIVLALPPQASFHLRAETSHGKIKSDFGSNQATGKGRMRLDLDVGQNPDSTIELHTSNGSITIQRRQSAKQQQRRREEPE
jgi:RNA polymerase sigma factor (sigma-70 family)